MILFVSTNSTMSSFTITLNGNSSNLQASYFPPIELDEKSNYVCGLIDFQTFNSIPNIDESNNRFYYGYKESLTLDPGEYSVDNITSVAKKQSKFKKVPGLDFFSRLMFENNIYPVDKSIHSKHAILTTSVYEIIETVFITYYVDSFVSIPVGSYEIADINDCLNKLLNKFNVKITIKVNKSTLKSELNCSHRVNFKYNNTIGSLLGFKDHILEPNLNHESHNPVNITKVNAVRIECNLISGAYLNDKAVHTIHEFFPTVSPGYKIVESPTNVIYLPITARRLHSVNIRILDQDDNLIDFRGETITLRIHIKKELR